MQTGTLGYPAPAAGGTGRGRLLKRTVYLSGTGTFRPSAAARTLAITMCGGGGGGSGSGGGGTQLSGGGGGAETWQGVIPANGSMAYAIGAAGAPSGNGGDTTLGHLIAFGGRAGTPLSGVNTGGGPGGGYDTNNSRTRTGSTPGGSGGGFWSGAGFVSNGCAPGLPAPYTSAPTITGGGTASSGSGGGSSLLGKGGNGATSGAGAGSVGTGYGAGGGGGGSNSGTTGAAGTGGYLMIEEYA